MIKLFLLLLLVSCGKIKIADSKHKVTVSADTRSYVSLRLEFIQELKDLCTDLLPAYENPNKILRKKLISQCTFDKMTLIDFKKFTEFNNEVCKNPVTVQEIDVCKVL